MFAIQLYSYKKLPWPLLNRTHGIRCVAEEIQNDLLKLNAVASHSWQVIGKFVP
jgi:hypothetical protein